MRVKGWMDRWWPTAEIPDEVDLDDDEPAVDWSKVRLSSSEFERRTARLERHELGLEPLAAIGEVHYAPARVLWTTTEPVVPGLYAIRVPGGPRRIVEVVADRRGRLTASWGIDVPQFPVAHSGMEWAGPYLEPE